MQVEEVELTFVIGGIFTSTLLTLLILPSVYEKFGVKIGKHENRH